MLIELTRLYSDQEKKFSGELEYGREYDQCRPQSNRRGPCGGPRGGPRGGSHGGPRGGSRGDPHRGPRGGPYGGSFQNNQQKKYREGEAPYNQYYGTLIILQVSRTLWDLMD